MMVYILCQHFPELLYVDALLCNNRLHHHLWTH